MCPANLDGSNVVYSQLKFSSPGPAGPSAATELRRQPYFTVAHRVVYVHGEPETTGHNNFLQ